MYILFIINFNKMMMSQKLKIMTIIVIIGISVLGVLKLSSELVKNDEIDHESDQNKNKLVFDLAYNPGGSIVNISNESDMFTMYSYVEDLGIGGEYKYSWFEQKKEFDVKQIKNESNTVVILPVFTHSAYAPNGFYDYFREKCDEQCLTVKIEREQPPQYNAGKNAIQILNHLDYSFISDIEVNENPSIIQKYDKVILLHNEYVTKKEFSAIVNHPNVIYLYPNSLYAEIEFDDEKDEIKLIRGHSYPISSIDNGFDWEFDNTRPYEFNTQCTNWEFHQIDNGVMLNCYPEQIIWKDELLLKYLKEF